jgi:peptide/nickel transport system substrate-binding protein
VWVANEYDGSAVAIDPATNTVARTVPVGGSLASLVPDGDGLWLAVGASASEHRGGTLTVASAFRAASLDPVSGDQFAWHLLSVTNDGLLAFTKVGGAEGATLVPDLATALPEVSADGLTYGFRLRQGIRYSTGDPVRPADFRHALERTFAIDADLAMLLYAAIDGADVCRSMPSECDLSGSIVVDEESVTFHLARPDSDLPYKLAMPPAFPVPATIGMEDQGFDPLPATGPYMIAEASADSIELVRNPAFREWSVPAQPDGFVDAITWRFNADPDTAFDELTAGELDWMTELPAPSDLESLRVAHPDQIVRSPSATTTFMGFDVQAPPFDDVRVRQALNYAIDRDHVVELFGGPTSHRPTCQILPPNFQGYEPFCPYTLDPESGAWSAPDLERARSLMAAANVTGERVTVWGRSDTSPFHGAAATTRYVVDVLNDLGLRARAHIVRDYEEYFEAVYIEGTAQVYMSGWVANYPGAGGFIDEQFRCGAPNNASGLCTPSLDAAIEEAQRLQTVDPAASNDAWADIEHQLVEDAVWVPLTNPVSTYVFSERVGNVQVHPQWSVLLSRLWVR